MTYSPYDDPSYQLAMAEARELGISLEVWWQRGTFHSAGMWHATAEWEQPARVRGRYIDNVWVDSDDDYEGQLPTHVSQQVGDSPGALAWAVINDLIDKGSI